ncbi:uncharacterized protein C1orf198 homolog [Dendroctonus ponderosae]|nr:uncharacterized protein C1orf198 homolog [Dendroctonus ponderosae]ERL84465.1 hypothetical protein D910_01896 [Dendroctonus ponderosae]KAH1004900.1 hypothetical protein HUJ05_005665 [Dendroctonus ponderosae]
MALKQLAAEYFGNLNPIASRINADLQDTKNAYEAEWNKLSLDEQEQILTETIIKPEVSVLYNQLEVGTNEDFAMKIVLDDHCSYRDEHSGPFSFRSRSQRNLTIFAEPPREPKTKFVPKLKVPPYTPDLDLVERGKDADSFSSNCNSLPKTGLDFLDNW